MCPKDTYIPHTVYMLFPKSQASCFVCCVTVLHTSPFMAMAHTPKIDIFQAFGRCRNYDTHVQANDGTYDAHITPTSSRTHTHAWVPHSESQKDAHTETENVFKYCLINLKKDLPCFSFLMYISFLWCRTMCVYVEPVLSSICTRTTV